MVYAELTNARDRRNVARSLRRTRAVIREYHVKARQAQLDDKPTEATVWMRRAEYYCATLAGAREMLAVLYT